MSTSEINDDDNNREEQISLTPPPLPDKHFQIDMFSSSETKQNDEKNDEITLSTPPKTLDESTQDEQYQTPKKLEPVLGKERAIKILKAFGNQQKPVKELHQNVLKTTPTKDSNKPKREKKSLTPMEKAKETISQIEELKKFKDRTIPTYFGENVVIHHIKVSPPPNEIRLDNNKVETMDKVNNESVGTKTTIDSLEALKVYNNVDVDKQSDEEIISDKDEQMYDGLSNDLMESTMKKRKLPAAFDLKAKRAKEKRHKRNSLDSRSSDKKRKHRNKDRKKKKSRDSSSRRSSLNSSGKRSKKKRGSTRETEISTHKSVSLESQSRDHQFERYTKTLPVIKYSPNQRYNQLLLTNGITDKGPASKKKKRSSSKSKDKRKKSSDRVEKAKVKERRRSGSKADKSKSAKKKKRDLEKGIEKSLENPKRGKEKPLDGVVPLKVDVINVSEKSPNSEEYQSSNWDNWDNWDAMDDITGCSMENLITLDTIPLQLNVPKQDRTLYTNNFTIKTPDEFIQSTPRMTKCDPAVVTPNILDSSEIKCQRTDSDDLESTPLTKVVKSSVSKLSRDNDLAKYISKLSPVRKNTEEPKSNHQPIAQLYDEYEQFIMSCMPTSEGNNYGNGDKSSIVSSLLDDTITSNDGEEELEALKISLEKKLHEMEHTDSEDATRVKDLDQPKEMIETILQPAKLVSKDSSDSSSSSSSSSSSDSSSSSSTSSPSRKKQRKKRSRKQKAKANNVLKIDDKIFNLKTGIEDDELSDNELLSKVEQLKKQFSEKRKALANKRKLVANDSESSESFIKSDMSDALLSPEKRSAISLKIGSSKPNAIMKPILLDDDDFTEKLLLEVTPNTLARTKETNKLLIERVIEPEVGLVSSSNSNSLASEIINTKVTRIGMMPNVSDIFPRSRKSVQIENEIIKITNQSLPVDTSEMKNYLNNSVAHFDSSDSITSKTSGSIDGSISCDSSSALTHKVMPMRQPTSPSRSDKRDSCDVSSKNRPLSPYHRSRTKEISGKRHSSPQPRNRSPRTRKRSNHRSPSPIRKRSRGSPRRSRSPRKSPRRLSPRRIRRSLSPRSKRPLSPIRGRPRTPPMPEKHTNRKWEPPQADYKCSTKPMLACDNNVPQPICRLESNNSTQWTAEENSAFAQYGYQHIQPLSPKRSLDDRIAHSFNHSDQSYDFHQASGAYMGHFQYSVENTNKIPVLNSQESYYFQPQHLPPQNMQPLPPQPLPPQHLPRQHVPPQHVQHMVPNQLSPQTLSTQHVPPPPLPQQRIFSNLIEIRQSNIQVEPTPTPIPTPTPFLVKGNVLEIVPKPETVADESRMDLESIKVEEVSCYEVKSELRVELTEEEIEKREIKKAEMKLKRKQERDKRHLERFMRKEKLKLEIKHLMEVSVHSAEIKKATYNPNAVGGKSILRLNASSLNKKSVLFADGVAPGDGTSTSGGEDVAPLLRDRNKRMTKKKLDSKRRRARKEASTIKKEPTPQVVDVAPFIDPELENMPPPLPPEGNPPARLAQPKLKSTPKLIYFHYDANSNAMYVSPYPTPVHIPQNSSEKSFSSITKPQMDSPLATSTPDLTQRPKVCFIQPPAFDQHSTQTQGPPGTPLSNLGVPNPNHPASMLSNSTGSTDVPTLLSMNPFNQQHQQPSSNSLPTSPALYPSRQVQSSSPQSYIGPIHLNNQPPMPVQPPPPMQPPPLAPQWDSGYQANAQISPLQPQQPCPQIWEPDIYFPSKQSIRPHTRFSNGNNVTQQRPSHNPWDQQRQPSTFQNQTHPSQSSFVNMQSHPRSNHPRFHQNQNQTMNPSHQQHNNFSFNANTNANYNYNTNANQSWNHQYRNNH